MSYRANVDIVVALNTLQITSFRKQGYLRFKLTLLQRTSNTLQSNKNKVHKSDRQREHQNDSFCSPYNIYKQPNNTIIIAKDTRQIIPLGGLRPNTQYTQ